MKRRRRDDMARNFRELQEKMSPESRTRSEARAQAMLKELPLSELREAQHLTQAELGKRLNIGQDAVSKLEHRADMYLSTLSDFIKAAGGSLELTARFPSGDVHLIRLQGASKPAKTTKSDRTEEEPANASMANLLQSLGPKRRAISATSRRGPASKRERAS
jgi:transcriptional regulator with XRE-family HTH domain